MTRSTWQRGLALVAVLASAASFAGALTLFAPASGAATISGVFHSVAPARVLDTRHVGAGTPVGSGQIVTLPLAGLAGLPAAGSFSAVKINVAVTAPTQQGYITVYSADASLPNTSNVNFVANQTVGNGVITSVSAAGAIKLHNQSLGSVQLIVDVNGYYTGTDAASGRGATGMLPTPNRVLDTRYGTGAAKAAVTPHGNVSFAVTGSGVPVDASAVILNVAVVSPTYPGNVTAYPAGHSVPLASSVNFAAGQVIPNLVVVPVGDGGKVAINNNSPGTVQLVADLFGYVTTGLPSNAGGFNTLPPARLLDTRTGNGGYTTPFSAFGTRTVTVAGRAGVPLAGAGSLVINVAVVAPSTAGYLTVYSGDTRPIVSNLNFAAGQTIANLGVTVADGGTITIFNGSPGAANVVVDVSGYYPSADRPVPTITSISRYLPNLTANTETNASTMQSAGCDDAHSGSNYILLDIGAQSENTTANAGDTLGPNNPGVALAQSSPTVRLTYPHLVSALNAYTAGFVSCTTSAATILVGTNNDGDFVGYTADAKGRDWADQVIDMLTSHSPQLTIKGADDIEAGFASTAAQASTWEQNFLSHTSANLVYNGSLDGCPTAFDSTAECAAGQSGAWTRADYVALTHTNGGDSNRISVLPQVYLDSQAVQWANIDASAGGLITFDGVLTQVGVCGTACSNDSIEGWTALYAAISTVNDQFTLPAMTDIVIS